MDYIIDGHNLIPLIIQGGLSNMDKENHLLSILQSFHPGAKSAIHVFFDKAPAGRAGVFKSGKITVHNVQRSTEADDVILRYLEELGKRAAEVVVVSSDRKIQSGAKRLRSKVISSNDFAKMLNLSKERSMSFVKEKPPLSPQDDLEIQAHFLKIPPKDNS